MSADVLVIGAGPVGLTAALLLARHGLRVCVLEKRLQPCPDPRAVSLDDEGLRIWQACGLGDALRGDWAAVEPRDAASESRADAGECICSYLDRHGRPFLRIRQRVSELGHPHAVSIHQGRIDATLMEFAERHPGIRVRRGHAVRRLEQTPQRIHLGGVDAEGRSFECDAPWAIACDGAGSVLRQQAGIAVLGSELPRPWLVANLIDRGPPGHVRIACRTDGAAVTMPLPHGLRRVEVELGCDDDGAWMDDESEVRRLLQRGWEGAANAPIASAVRCRFRAVVAERWRDRRLFLAGDAAHSMPPFAGQGLGAGLRDVFNLAFKIAGVAQGWLPPSTLESYEAERRPHVERITRLACRLGRLMSPRSAPEALATQWAVRTLGACPALGSRWLLRGPCIQPTLGAGFIERGVGAGRYLPQPTVLLPDGRTAPLDELLGPRMTWIALASRSSADLESSTAVPPELRRTGDALLTEGRDFHDPEGLLRRRYGDGALLRVRPDRVVHSCLRASAWSVFLSRARRALHLRRTACPLDAVSTTGRRPVVRRQRRAASAPPRSSSPSQPSAAASPTARIRWWRSAPRISARSTPGSSSSWSTRADGTST